MTYEYDPYLTKSTAKGMYVISVGMIACAIYLVPVSLHAWRTNTMIHIGNTGHSLLWPWEGFATSFLMLVVGVFAFWAAGRKAKEWKARQQGSHGR